jgi:protein involved in polysaccharide export with SLBB domain
MIRPSLFLVLALAFSGVSFGQTPTPEQLEMLRNLTPQQRAALEQQVGATPGASGAIESTNGQKPLSGDEIEIDQPADSKNGQPELDEESRLELAESRRRVLRGDDSVIIDLKFKLTPKALEEAQQQSGQTSDVDAQRSEILQDTLEQARTNPGQAELSPRQIEELRALRDLVLSKNPYRLSRDGFLQMPGFSPIALAGLNEFQASLRLSVLVEFRDFDVQLRRLPVRRTGVEALKPFGYELFERRASTLRPVTDVPVPSDYVVGAGDQIEVQLYGNQNRTLRLTVGRDGRVSFPELGPIAVGGQSFSAVKSAIEARVSRQMIGVRASVSMGDTRGIRVFVFGEARNPGSYTISGLGTITSALFAAGGVRPIGSLRKVELKRNGQVVRTFDLYDMLIRGDTTDDAKLLPGDVVFIPPVGPVVSVDGEVRRPAIYESLGETTVQQIIELAGGLTPDADVSRVSLTRIDANGRRTVIGAQLSADASQPVRNGDLLRVSRLRPTLDSGIVLEGHVHAPASFAFHDGQRLTDVIGSVDDLKSGADLHYILIRRELPPDRRVTVLSADLGAALAAPDSPANIALMPRDRLTVFDLVTGRDRIIRPLVDELKLQANYQNPTSLVYIDGRAKLPGVYPLEPGMTVRDLVRAGGSLSDAAFGGRAELTRYKVINGDQRRTELVEIDLGAALRGDTSANLLLQPFDSLNIKEVPDWGEQETIELLGEVRFPGRYAIARGETLRSVLARAGGLSDLAFPAGSVFTREELRSREQQQLNILADRLQKDLAVLAIQGAAANQSGAASTLQFGQTLMSQLRASKAVGRLVINVPRVVASNKPAEDILLRNGDRLMIPKLRQEITVIGEVQSPTSHLYRAELGRDDYIGLSGGATRKADKSKVYVVRADGTVIASGGNSWFSRSAQVGMQPGDTVVVPLDTERMPALPFWQAVTQIIYNLGISAAAVNSF